LAEHVERRASGEFRADAQLAVGSLKARLLQIGEVALGGGAAANLLAAVLREKLLAQHALERGELNVYLDCVGERRGQ
jgi:hypothetical protein